MMENRFSTMTRSEASVLSTNKVIRNTYMLLSLTLAFSALMAAVSMSMGAPRLGIVVTLVGYFGLLFATSKFRNSGLGVLFVFALTGFMGFTLGPIISAYLSMPNGSSIVMQAMAGTAAIFLGLSAYAVTTKKDFSFMGKFLFVGLILLIVASLANLFFAIPALSVALSAIAVLIFSAYILYDISRIVNGGEDNYISATLAVYLDVYNVFVSLLNLLMAFGGNRD